jgi:hypothetical protein
LRFICHLVFVYNLIIKNMDKMFDPPQLRSEGDWNHLMSELTPEPDSTGGENKKKLIKWFSLYMLAHPWNVPSHIFLSILRWSNVPSLQTMCVHLLIPISKGSFPWFILTLHHWKQPSESCGLHDASVFSHKYFIYFLD